MLLPLLVATALAGPRPAASEEWVLVDDTALLCSHPGRTGTCVRFRQPDASQVDGAGPRVFRVVGRRGGEIEIQAQFDAGRAACGVLPGSITPLTLRLFAPATAVETIDDEAACLTPEARLADGPWRDPVARRQRVATVAQGAWVTWPDGALAGQVRWDVWLQERHGLYQEGGRWCASFDLGPEDGGAVSDRVLDLCFDARDLTLH